MTQMWPFFIVLLAGLFFSEVFERFHLPWVSSLIIAGMLLGPSGTDILVLNDTIIFLGEIGLIFLMFLAGLETRLSALRKDKGEISKVTFVNSAIPFLIGFAVSWVLFDQNVLTSLLLGTIFIASSIAVIIPSFRTHGLIGTRFGEITIGSTVIMDILSLLLVSFLLQSTHEPSSLPLPLFYVLAVTAIILLRWLVIWAWKKVDAHVPDDKDPFQEEFRFLFMVLIGIVIVFEILGLHPVLAGFFAGFVLSEAIRSEVLIQKFRSIGYGLFVPIFFIVLGANTDLSVFSNFSSTLLVVGVIAASAMGAKYISGVIAGKMIGFSASQGRLLGVATMPHLTTTLVAGMVGVEAGILSDTAMTAIILLIIVTSFVSPLLIRYMSRSPEHQKTA